MKYNEVRGFWRARRSVGRSGGRGIAVWCDRGVTGCCGRGAAIAAYDEADEEDPDIEYTDCKQDRGRESEGGSRRGVLLR
jgi:hypothetical protein